MYTFVEPLMSHRLMDLKVLYDQKQHISSAIWKGQDHGTQHCHEHILKINDMKVSD